MSPSCASLEPSGLYVRPTHALSPWLSFCFALKFSLFPGSLSSDGDFTETHDCIISVAASVLQTAHKDLKWEPLNFVQLKSVLKSCHIMLHIMSAFPDQGHKERAVPETSLWLYFGWKQITVVARAVCWRRRLVCKHLPFTLRALAKLQKAWCKPEIAFKEKIVGNFYFESK